jgi:membrane protease YdiL (CAAX protease family)
MTAPPGSPNRVLLLPYALPYLLYVGLASIPGDQVGREFSYGLRIVVCGAALAWAWRSYVPLRGPASVAGSLGWGVVAGLAGTALWIGLLAPLAPQAGAVAWGDSAFALRLVAVGAVVPLLEELLFRGYVLRLVVQWDRARAAGEPKPRVQALDRRSIADVEPGAWTPVALAVSTLLFAAGHLAYEWPAALAYGLWMAGLWIVRKDLLSCVFAHAVTNVTLAIYVRAAGAWQLW